MTRIILKLKKAGIKTINIHISSYHIPSLIYISRHTFHIQVLYIKFEGLKVEFSCT